MYYTYSQALAVLKRCPPGEGWRISSRRDGKGAWRWCVVTEKPR